MRTLLSLAAAVLTWLMLVSLAAGRDVYVDNLAGDDTFTGDRPDSTAARTGPVRTITRALRLARQGDRIVLAKTAEPYRESISLVGSRHSGFSFRRFVIAGNGAILDGSAPVPQEAWEHYDGPVFRFRPRHLEYQQLFLDDQPVPRVTASRPGQSPPALEPLQWCLHGAYIYFCVEWGKLPENYPLTYADKRVGITLFHVDQVAVTDLTVQGFQLDGINAHNTARDVVIQNVTCRGNGRAGIAVGGASLVDVDECLIGNNGHAQLLVLPWSKTHVRNCQLLANTAPAVVHQGGQVYIDGRPMEGEVENP